MKYLLDTHIILWMLEDNKNLSERAKNIIPDDNNEVYYSTASIWETSIKKMVRPYDINITGSELAGKCMESGLENIPIMDKHVAALETLKRNREESDHNDPFDRILLAQAKSEGMILMTHDSKILGYNENCVMKV